MGRCARDRNRPRRHTSPLAGPNGSPIFAEAYRRTMRIRGRIDTELLVACGFRPLECKGPGRRRNREPDRQAKRQPPHARRVLATITQAAPANARASTIQRIVGRDRDSGPTVGVGPGSGAAPGGGRGPGPSAIFRVRRPHPIALRRAGRQVDNHFRCGCPQHRWPQPAQHHPTRPIRPGSGRRHSPAKPVSHR